MSCRANRGANGPGQRDLVWSGHRDRGDDERGLLSQLGLELVGHELAWWIRRIRWSPLLRERGVARRVRCVRLPWVWRLRQRGIPRTAGSAQAYHGTGAGGVHHTGGSYQTAWGGGSAHTGYAPNGAVHTGGSGYNASGQAYHYGASKTPTGQTSYHATTASGQHVAGSTAGGWGHDDGWSSRAASTRGWGSMGGGAGADPCTLNAVCDRAIGGEAC